MPIWHKTRLCSPYINRFLQPDTLISGVANPQSWNRYAYGQNSPIRYSDPTGHRIVEGCSELAGGCNVTQQTIDNDLKKENYFRQRTDGNKCRSGNKLYCSYAENHPIETAASAVVGLAAPGAIEYVTLGGGLAGAIKGLLPAGATACVSGVAECENQLQTGLNAASSYANKVLLQKSLASEAQLGEVGFTGRLIAMGEKIRDVPRLISTYGGEVTDWMKLSSSRFTALDQVTFETHWYANKVLNMIVDIKTKIIP